MIKYSIKKGYEFKVGDSSCKEEPQFFLQKLYTRKKLEDFYIDSPAEIIQILHNNCYKLQMLDGSPISHSKQAFTRSDFKLYHQSNNQITKQKITSHQVLPAPALPCENNKDTMQVEC